MRRIDKLAAALLLGLAFGGGALAGVVGVLQVSDLAMRKREAEVLERWEGVLQRGERLDRLERELAAEAARNGRRRKASR